MSGVDPRLREHLAVAEPPDDEFVDAAFALVLRRPPDREARERALARLAEVDKPQGNAVKLLVGILILGGVLAYSIRRVKRRDPSVSLRR